jgi:hypothetical protein
VDFYKKFYQIFTKKQKYKIYKNNDIDNDIDNDILVRFVRGLTALIQKLMRPPGDK